MTTVEFSVIWTERSTFLISRYILEPGKVLWEESMIRGEESHHENVVVVEKRVILERKMMVGV